MRPHLWRGNATAGNPLRYCLLQRSCNSAPSVTGIKRISAYDTVRAAVPSIRPRAWRGMRRGGPQIADPAGMILQFSPVFNEECNTTWLSLPSRIPATFNSAPSSTGSATFLPLHRSIRNLVPFNSAPPQRGVQRIPALPSLGLEMAFNSAPSSTGSATGTPNDSRSFQFHLQFSPVFNGECNATCLVPAGPQ